MPRSSRSFSSCDTDSSTVCFSCPRHAFQGGQPLVFQASSSESTPFFFDEYHDDIRDDPGPSPESAIHTVS